MRTYTARWLVGGLASILEDTPISTWDSADMLARAIFLADRPSGDVSVTTAQWYNLLSEGQVHWTRQIAIHAPHVLLTAPTALTAGTGNLTYTFPSSIRPLYALVYTSATGDFLRPGSWDDPGADYVWEDDKIRMTRGTARVFPSTVPYARYVAPATVMDGTTAPTLKPDDARVLCVYYAVAEWARRGGKRDPSPFEAKMQQLAWGLPGTGDIGIIGTIKAANPFKGMEAFGQSQSVRGYAYLTYPRGY